MSPAKRISLGAALAGAAPAEDCFVPGNPIPGTWVDLFKSEHTDGGIWHGLFMSCRGCRDWTLQKSQKAVATLFFASATSQAALQKQQQSVLSRIRVRAADAGAAPPEIVVVCDGTPASAAAAAATLSAVAVAAPGISVLTLELTKWAPLPDVWRVFLNDITTTLPRLTKLSIKNISIPIPPHNKMPHLQELSATVEQHNATVVLRSIAPYFSQLTSLHVQLGFRPNPSWPLTLTLPSDDHISNTLTTLSTNAPLTDELIQFVKDRAPNVEDISVGMWEEWDVSGWAGQTWPVKQLTVVGAVTLSDAHLMSLPATIDNAPLTVRGVGCVVDWYVMDAQGLGVTLLQYLPGWRLQVKNIDLSLSPNMPATARPEALRNAMTQVATLPHPRPVHLRQPPSWYWTESMLRVLAEAPAHVPDLNAAVHIDELTVELLILMLQARRHIASVYVGRLSLQSDTHAHTAWPWGELTCDTVDLSQMVTKLPHLSAARDVTVHTKEIIITETLIEMPTDCLRRIQWAALAPAPKEEATCVELTLHCTEGKQCALLDFGRHLHMREGTEVQLRLSGWMMSRAALGSWRPSSTEPGALPPYITKLDLSQCTQWPLSAQEYARVFRECLPPQCTVLRMPQSAMHQRLKYELEGMVRSGSTGKLVVELGAQCVDGA